jgi:hypothetical protein
MKKLIPVAVGAMILLVLAMTGPAEAKCGTKCLNKKVRALSAGLAAAQQTIALQGQRLQQTTQELSSLENCLGEAPLTQYGDPAGTFGYMFDNDAIGSGGDPFETTALDITESGDQIDGWALFDFCNTTSVASASAAQSSSIAPRSEAGRFGGGQMHSP